MLCRPLQPARHETGSRGAHLLSGKQVGGERLKVDTQKPWPKVAKQVAAMAIQASGRSGATIDTGRKTRRRAASRICAPWAAASRGDQPAGKHPPRM